MSYNVTLSFHKGTCASSCIAHNKREIVVPHIEYHKGISSTTISIPFSFVSIRQCARISS